MLLWGTLVLSCAGAQAQKLAPGLWEHQARWLAAACGDIKPMP